MGTVVKFFGVAIIVLGGVFLATPKAFRKYIEFWRDTKRLKLGGILALAFGIAFLMVAPHCRFSALFVFFGIWSLIKGVILFFIKQNFINGYLDWWLGKPAYALRLVGLLAVVFGVLIVYAV